MRSGDGALAKGRLHPESTCRLGWGGREASPSGWAAEAHRLGAGVST